MTIENNRRPRFIRSLRTTAVFPLIVFILFTSILVAQILAVNNSNSDVDRADRISAQATRILNLAIDQETGERAYLLEGRPIFLEPYVHGKAEIGPAFDTLQKLVVNDPDQELRARQMQQAYAQWADATRTQIQERGAGLPAYRSLSAQQASKSLMDDFRGSVQVFINAEAADRTVFAHRDRILTSYLLRMAYVLAFTGALIVALVSTFSMRALAVEYEALLAETRRSRELLNTTLHSIGDAVLVTDAQGRITLMNSVAEELTGWSLADAAGREARSVFRIFNHQTREVVISPIDRVIREGVVVGLANHTVLVHKAGHDIYIDDSGAPIRSKDGDLVGVVLVFRDISERYRQEAALHDTFARQLVINQISLAIRRTADPLEIQTLALKEMGRALQVDRCLSIHLDSRRDSVDFSAEWHTEGLPDLRGEYPLSHFRVDLAQVFPAGASLVLPDIEDGQLSADTARVVLGLGLRSLIVVPQSRDSEVVGLLAVCMTSAVREWTRDELSFVEAVASLIRSATDAALQLKRAEARAERESLLNKIGEALRTARTPERIQTLSVHLLAQALHVDRCYVATYDLSRGVVTVASEWRRPDLPAIEGVYPFKNTVEMFHELYRDTSTSVVDDCYAASLSAQTIANMEGLQIRARVSVAIAETDEHMSTLTAAMSDAPRNWKEEDIDLIEAVATHLRATVELARVQQREHRIASELQEALLPSAPRALLDLKVASYTQPALDEAAVGGDFFDVFPLNEGVCALVIGDVSGKGLAAAAQLAAVRNMLRAFLYHTDSTAEALTSLNNILIDHDLLTGFVTVFVGRYDSRSGVLTYGSCGHEPALISRRAGGPIETTESTGPPLGVTPNYTYADLETVLEIGDSLLLYTDGLSEAGSTRSDLLGTAGLIGVAEDLLPQEDVDQIARALISRVSAYAHGQFHDDVCMLIVRRGTA